MTNLSSNQETKVVVGINGKIDSAVTAYLLLKQGYQVVGCYVEKKVPKSSSVSGCQEAASLENSVKIAKFLKIPLEIVETPSAFIDLFEEKGVASKILGINFFPCTSCFQYILESLEKKREELKASKIAIGVFSKIVWQKKRAFLWSSNELSDNQSYLLSKVPSGILENLLLPLGDLRKKDVIKMASNFPDIFSGSSKKRCIECWNKSSSSLLEENLPDSLKFPGNIVLRQDKSIFSAHEGIYQYSLGQTEFKDALGKSITNKGAIVGFNRKEGEILLDNPDTCFFPRPEILLKSVNFCGNSLESFFEAQEFWMQINDSSLLVETLLWPVTLGFTKATLKNDLKFPLYPGDEVYFYQKEEKNLILLLQATIFDLRPLFKLSEEEEEAKKQNSQNTIVRNTMESF